MPLDWNNRKVSVSGPLGGGFCSVGPRPLVSAARVGRRGGGPSRVGVRRLWWVAGSSGPSQAERGGLHGRPGFPGLPAFRSSP
jgi:hypothetical protein